MNFITKMNERIDSGTMHTERSTTPRASQVKRNVLTVNDLIASDFPPSVRPFWENMPGTDPQLRLATTLAATVCYCGLSPRLRVKYTYDLAHSMLLLNLLCIGSSGSGKSIIRWVVNLLMNEQIMRDQNERRKLREYKEASRRKGANKDKGEEPLVAIRFLQKFTLPVIVKYADLIHRRYDDWLSFFLFGDELAAFTENRRGNGDFRAVARTAYALGETYSRDTLYQDGYNAMVDIDWCSVMCGQEQALEKYIDKNGIVQGDAGRQILVKLNDNIGEDAPTIRPLTERQTREINQTVSQLMRETFTDDDQLMPTHEVDMSWLDKDVKAWCNRTREQILKTGSRAMDSFYVRASVSSFRLATMLYHLWGENPAKQRQVRRCYHAFAQMILDNSMAQWGQEYENAMPKSKESADKKPTLYDRMPKRWTRDMLRDMIAREGLGTPTRLFIFKWLKKKWIYEVEKDVYEKIY